MNRFIKTSLLTLMLFFTIITSLTSCSLLTDDKTYLSYEIEDYILKVNMRSDASLSLTYNLSCKAIDEKVDTLIIRVPNKYVDDFSYISDNIKNITYSGLNGAYLYIKLNQTYSKDTTFDVAFSSVQSRIYTLNEENDTFNFSYSIGGYSDEIIKKGTILWNSDNVMQSDSTSSKENYLVWSSAINNTEESIKASVSYSKYSFSADDSNQYTDDWGKTDMLALVLIVTLGSLVVLITIIEFIGNINYKISVYIENKNHKKIVQIRNSCATCASCVKASGQRYKRTNKDYYKTNAKSDDIINSLK